MFKFNCIYSNVFKKQIDSIRRIVKFESRFNFSENSKYKATELSQRQKIKSTVYYVAATAVLTLGFSYAAVPLYRMFCQAYSYGGTVSTNVEGDNVESMKKVKERVIRVMFNADRGSSMRWNFKPQQTEIKVVPGETVLAFYTAENPTDVPVTGISTYNVIPFEAGQYFNKIQCFCFEEQLLNPHEQHEKLFYIDSSPKVTVLGNIPHVDMPVFFYIDPEFAEDPRMEFVEDLVLSYTFFEAKEGLSLPVPSFFKK